MIVLNAKQLQILTLFAKFNHEKLTRDKLGEELGDVELIEDDIKFLDEKNLIHAKYMDVTVRSRLGDGETTISFMNGEITGNGINFFRSLGK